MPLFRERRKIPYPMIMPNRYYPAVKMYNSTLIWGCQWLVSSFVLGDELRKARVAAGFTQEELAAKAGISREYVNYLERGKRSPTIPMFLKVCAALKVYAPDLLAKVMRSR